MKEELKYQWLQLKLILTTLSTKKILSLQLLIKVTQNVCLSILINRKRRGGRGISGLTTREEDFVEHLFTTTTHHTLLFFTTHGVVYKLKGYQIPEASRQAKGTAIVNLLPLENDEKISAMIPIKDFEDGKYLTFITKNGIVKKTNVMDYSKNP